MRPVVQICANFAGSIRRWWPLPSTSLFRIGGFRQKEGKCTNLWSTGKLADESASVRVRVLHFYIAGVGLCVSACHTFALCCRFAGKTEFFSSGCARGVSVQNIHIWKRRRWKNQQCLQIDGKWHSKASQRNARWTFWAVFCRPVWDNLRFSNLPNCLSSNGRLRHVISKTPATSVSFCRPANLGCLLACQNQGYR